MSYTPLLRNVKDHIKELMFYIINVQIIIFK